MRLQQSGPPGYLLYFVTSSSGPCHVTCLTDMFTTFLPHLHQVFIMLSCCNYISVCVTKIPASNKLVGTKHQRYDQIQTENQVHGEGLASSLSSDRLRVISIDRVQSYHPCYLAGSDTCSDHEGLSSLYSSPPAKLAHLSLDSFL